MSEDERISRESERGDSKMSDLSSIGVFEYICYYFNLFITRLTKLSNSKDERDTCL